MSITEKHSIYNTPEFIDLKKDLVDLGVSKEKLTDIFEKICKITNRNIASELMNKPIWTIEETAYMSGCKPRSLSSRISEMKKTNPKALSKWLIDEKGRQQRIKSKQYLEWANGNKSAGRPSKKSSPEVELVFG